MLGYAKMPIWDFLRDHQRLTAREDDAQEKMEMQSVVSHWMGQLAEYLPFGYAFGAGMVSAVNPCGFAMLPVYISLYLGAGDADFYDSSRVVRFMKAAGLALVVTSGFALLFGAVGIAASLGGVFLMEITPWLSIFVGGALIFLGGRLLIGGDFSWNFMLRISGKIGDPGKMTLKSFFLFGTAFGATSLGCTLPVFLAVVGGALTSAGFLQGLFQFCAYILGMASVLLTLTLGIAFLREGAAAEAMRKITPWLRKISALVIILAGAYIVRYWLSSGLL